MKRDHIAVKMVIDRWEASLKSFDTLVNELSDVQLAKDIVVGKNRGVYLLGHMIAAHDSLLILLGLHERQYPELEEMFLKAADKVVAEIPNTAELRKMWAAQCALIQKLFATMSVDNWFEKHTAVSAEDFEKEPHRNKLNIVLTRSTHLNYHTGQLKLLK